MINKYSLQVLFTKWGVSSALLILFFGCFAPKMHGQESSESSKNKIDVKISDSPSLPHFAWKDGKKAALSLSFDDARLSQVDIGTPLFDNHDVNVTFYVLPKSMEPRLDKWKNAVVNGHEIGNHTVNHPCTGNFNWSRDHALEDYTLKSMRKELIECNLMIKRMIGVEARSFAYTCGNKFVGRGRSTKSYVPLISKMFESGRGWLNESSNAPGYLDLAQLLGIEMDGKNFDQIKPILEKAKIEGSWVVLAGHEINEDGIQTTRVSMLEELIAYVKDPANGIWLATVGEVAEYLKAK